MSKMDMIRSQRSLPSGSYQRVNLVTEAQSVLPSFTSAYSIESIEERQSYLSPTSELLRRRVLISGLDEYITSSCQNIDEPFDPYDNPDYTDTVKSNDSTGSMLRRSLSVPPEYTFKSGKRTHARDVFGELTKAEHENQHNNTYLDPRTAEKKRKWRQTMAELFESPEYIDSLESTSSGTALLARTAATIKDTPVIPTAVQTSKSVHVQEGQQYKYVKNLIILALSFFFIFGSYLSIRNLQSSVIADSTLAFLALSTVYGSLFVGCIFATTAVQRLRPKRTMLLAMQCMLWYTAANLYPQYYTLIPAAAMVGFSMGILWTAQATYLTNMSACYAEITGKTLQNVVSKFNGIFFGIFGTSQVLGGLISSLVLMSQQDTPELLFLGPPESNLTNSSTMEEVTVVSIPSTQLGSEVTFCGSKYCSSAGSLSKVRVSQKALSILLGIYAGLIVVGILINMIFLDPLEGVMAKSHASLCAQMSAVFRWFADYRVLCLSGLSFYSLIQLSFLFGEFNQAYVTCPYGVHMVGYAMICQSAASSVSAYVNGRVQKYIGQLPLFFIG